MPEVRRVRSLPPAGIARSTHVAAVAGFILMAVAATAGYALSDAPMLWVFLRFMAGFGLSGAFATVESWLNLGTKDDWRARVFSIYLMVQLGGLAAGQLFLNARGFGNELLFLIASVLTLSAVGFLRFEVVENPHFEAPQKMGLEPLVPALAVRRVGGCIIRLCVGGADGVGARVGGVDRLERFREVDIYDACRSSAA